MKSSPTSASSVLSSLGLVALVLVACGPQEGNGDDGPGGGDLPAVGGAYATGAAPSTGAAPGTGTGASAGTGAGSSSGGATGNGGSITGTPGDGGAPVIGTPTLPDGRGATVPYVEYEAEDMSTNGTVLGPTRTFGQVAAEASGRKAVRLSSTGQYVSFTNKSASNSIVVRYSIPDGGQDYWTTLGVYVDGELRTRLSVTSRYSWTYGDESHFNKPDQNNPGLGHPHHFFDESRALIGDIPVGATVMLRKDAEDGAAHYDIDLVDMEPVPAALTKPFNFVSLTECGAVPNDNKDDSGAIQDCVDKARGEGKGVFVPVGVFNSWSKAISVAGVTIRGAGMWHSTIAGYYARFDCWGNDCKYHDFSVFGDTIQRIDDSPETAFSGNGSSGTLLENIWIEHAKVGYWTGPNTNGLVIRKSRMRNLFADGVNFYGGATNSVVEETHARNTGDDAFAMWSPGDRNTNTNNVFRHNHVQVPWKANCFAIYGGADNRIEDNVCADVVQYPGILLARQFGSRAFTGTTHVDRNSLIRAGGMAYGQQQGAFKLHADQAELQHVSVTELDVFAPTYSAIQVQGQNYIDSVWFDGVTVTSPGSSVFHLSWGSEGACDAANVVVTGSPAGVVDESSGNFKVLRGTGNSGW